MKSQSKKLSKWEKISWMFSIICLLFLLLWFYYTFDVEPNEDKKFHQQIQAVEARLDSLLNLLDSLNIKYLNN